jgi:hypothetical protein
MKLAPGCYECLRRLSYQVAELATNDVSLRQSGQPVADLLGVPINSYVATLQ